MSKRISRAIAGSLGALLALAVLVQPAVARAEGVSQSPDPTLATPTASPTPADSPTPTQAPSSSPSASAQVAPQGGSVNPLVTDDSNGVVTVKIAQAGADSTGTRSAATGTKFDYKLSLTCSSQDGPCLTDGKVTLDLSQWKGYQFSFGADTSSVLSHDWNPSTGLLTLDLADLGLGGYAFTWSFSITTPANVTSIDANGIASTLTFDALVSGKDFEPVTSRSVTSKTTAVLPTNKLEKQPASGTEYIGSVGDITWNIFDTMGATTGIVLPTEYRVITDVLPAGVTYVDCHTDATSTWEACTYDGATRTVTFLSKSLTVTGNREQVGHIVTSIDDPALVKSYSNTAAIDMGAEHKTATATVSVQNPPNPEPAGPRYSSYKAEKYSEAPIVWSYNTVPYPADRPKSVGTFTGEWKDDGTGVNTEARYSIGFADGGETTLKGVGVVDDVPCLTNKSGSAGSATYSSQKGNLCLEPAFYLTHVDTDYGYYNSDTNRQGPDVPIDITLTDGTVITLPWTQHSGTAFSGYTRWDIPQQYWGRVARVEIKPTWTSGDPKPSNNGKRKGLWVQNNTSGLLRFNGYIPANKGIVDGDTVRNTQADVTFVQDPKGSYAGYPDKTLRSAIDWGTTGSPHVEADIKVVDALQGAGKAGVVTTNPADGPSQVDWTLRAYSQTGLEDLVGPFVTITDLWPSTVPLPDELLTQPTKWFDHDTTTVVASVTPSVTLSTTAAPHKLQWKLPVAVFNTMQHANQGSKVWVSAQLPSATVTGYGNTVNELDVQMSPADNPKGNISDGTSVNDTNDLDGDAATTKMVQAKHTVSRPAANGAAGYEVTKAVKGDLNNGFMFNPARGATTPGTGTADFQLTWKNTGGAPLNETVLYDILPWDGDLGTLLYATDRGSSFTPTLTSVPAPGAGIKVWYSQSTNPCRPELVDDVDISDPTPCVDDWTQTAPALNTVKALKWTNTNSYNTGQSWSVHFNMQAPATITDPDVAWNDVAGNAKLAADGSAVGAVSAPKVGLHNAQTGDAVWQKVNGLGNKLTGSQWEFQAVDGSDNPVGSAITVTDNVGAGGYVGKDIDPKPGFFRLAGLDNLLTNATKYRLIETLAPAGYVLDQTPHYATSKMNDDWGFGDIVDYLYTVPGASGNVTATYDVDYDWSLTKSATPLTQSVDPNTDADIDYTVTVTAAPGAPTNLAVSGSATFTNPSGPNLAGTVSVASASGSACTLTNGSAVTIVNSGLLAVPFTCANGAIDDDTVTVTFTPDGGFTAASVDLPVSFRIGTETDKNIVLTDTFAELNGPRTLNAADIVADGGSKAYTYTAKRLAGGPGLCLPYSNTASLAASSDQGVLTDTVDVEVCGKHVAPTTDTAGGQATYNTDYDWALAKTVDQNVVEVAGGATQPFAYNVTVTPTKSTNTVTSTGWVEFVNPNDIELTGTVTLAALTGSCTLFGSDTLTIPAGSSEYAYFDCTYPDAQPTADDQVTVTFTSEPTPSGVLVATKVVTLAFTEFDVTDQVTTVSDTFTEFGGDKTLDAEDLLADPSLGVFAYTANQTASTTPGVCDSYPNTASLAATSDQPVLSQSVTADLCTQATPGLDLTKTADKATFVAGDPINYTFVAENTGDSSLSNVVISEPVGGFNGSGVMSAIGDCKVGSAAATMPVTLAPGEVLTCTASYLATQADLDQGSLVNTAHVDGAPAYGPHLSDDDSVTVTGDQHSAIDLTKTADQTKLAVGETVTYKFTTTNTGNTTLSEVTVTEQEFDGAGKLGPIGGCLVDGVAVAMPATLAPGKVLTCTAAYVVVQADVDRGSLINHAHVEGTPPGTDPSDPVDPTDPDAGKPMDDDSVEITGSSNPGIELVKTANRTEFGFGDTVTYTLTATNTGDVTLAGVKISETDFNGGKLPAISGCQVGGSPVTMPATLAPGQVLSCTAKYVASRADVLRGDLMNVARVVGTPPTGPDTTDGSEVDLSARRDVKLALEKKVAQIVDTNDNSVVDAGDKILWSFKVTNFSRGAVSKLAIADQLLADAGVKVTCPTKKLAAGASATCRSTSWYVVTEQDVERGRVFNTATASVEGSKKRLYLSNPDATITPTNYTAVLPAQDATGDEPAKDLAFTGFAGWSIAVAGGLFVVLGAVVLVLVRRRRAGQEG